MLHDLLVYDLSSFNVRAVPTTEGLQHQRKLSLPTTEAWWLDCLERGYVFRSRLGLEAKLSAWQDKATTELLHASHVEFTKARGERRIMSREWLGRFFTRLGGDGQVSRSYAVRCPKNAASGRRMAPPRRSSSAGK